MVIGDVGNLKIGNTASTYFNLFNHKCSTQVLSMDTHFYGLRKTNSTVQRFKPQYTSTSTLYVVGQAIFQAPFTALYHGSQGAGCKLKTFKSNKSMKSNKSVKSVIKVIVKVP